ncbi:MAG TPA: response regulator [Tepidisphaeraceae bacterium]|nr:response regulator [Tepidisphaeraceae bacterium]
MAYLLIVDDDTDGREALCKYLENAGHEVKCVSNGRDALSSILARCPDLVILDLLMPEMDGPSLLEILRSYLRLQVLPVIVLTGLRDSPILDRMRALRVNSILVKGKASLEDVRAAVEHELPRMPR